MSSDLKRRKPEGQSDMTLVKGASTTTEIQEWQSGWIDGERLRSALTGRSIALDRELDRGGMSIVYLARDLRHNRLVAVKILRPDAPAGAERFVREIKLTSRLVHPNIVPLFDSGAVEGFPFFVMPYIEGESLWRRLQRERRLEIGDAVRIAGEIGEALEFAHRHEILHRDIKPENILLQAGHAVVADFGVARALCDAATGEKPGERLTEQGLVVGTAEYMSPEQAVGDRAVDGRTDVYSLGCVLYEMLTGALPFIGDSPREVLDHYALASHPGGLAGGRRAPPGTGAGNCRGNPCVRVLLPERRPDLVSGRNHRCQPGDPARCGWAGHGSGGPAR
jgi:eukaryotic-like serine/threonine-protein kinase